MNIETEIHTANRQKVVFEVLLSLTTFNKSKI